MDEARCVFLTKAAALLLRDSSSTSRRSSRRGSGSARWKDGGGCEAMAAYLLAPLGSAVASDGGQGTGSKGSASSTAQSIATSATRSRLTSASGKGHSQGHESVFSSEMSEQVCRNCGAVFALQPPRRQRRHRKGKRQHRAAVTCSCCGVACWQGKPPRTATKARRPQKAKQAPTPSTKPKRAILTPLLDRSMRATAAHGASSSSGKPPPGATPPHQAKQERVDKQPEEKESQQEQDESKKQKQRKKPYQRKKQALQHILGRSGTPGGKRQKKKRKSKGGQGAPALTLQDVLQQCKT